MSQTLLGDREAVYDIEVANNLFLLCSKELGTGIRKRFQISPYRNDRRELLLYLNTLTIMTGFNNLRFDYPLLHRIIQTLSRDINIKGRELLKLINVWSAMLINSQEGYQNEIRNPFIKQRDLFRIHHFDNKAKRTSLKGLEFVMRMDNIQELPFKPGVDLSFNEIQETEYYCDNDVDATFLLREKYTSEQIAMRDKLSPKYGIDFTNFNDVKIGEQIFIKKIELKGGRHLMYDEYNKIKNTSRTEIVVNDILVPLQHFTTPRFRALHKYFQDNIIKQIGDFPILNGAFSMLQPAHMQEYFGDFYKEEIKIKKLDDEYQAYLSADFPPDLVYKPNKKTGEEIPYLQYQDSLNIIFKDRVYYYGAGGIHMSIEPGVYEADEEFCIMDIDVEGYYPSESYIHRFEPEHLKGYYADTHGEIKEERKQYPKKTPENTGLKLAGNGTYGKGNSDYSPLKDPQYVAQTCINGQLFLSMLIERVNVELSYCSVLQANTDGFTMIIKRSELEKAKAIVARWEAYTKLKMEFAYYSKMIINDVNNYIAIPEGEGKPKFKGLFVYEGLELHKNWSQLVVPKAIAAYFINGKLPEEFIPQHEDLYDFFKRTKLQRSHRLVGRTNFEERIEMDYSKSKRGRRIKIPTWTTEIPYQGLSRYYVSSNGVALFKIMPPTAKNPDKIREMAVEAGKVCTVVNRIQEGSFEEMKLNLDYDYYVEEAYKVIRSIENHEHIDVVEEDGEN